jgi:surfeit locus 1 family protein
MSPGSFLRTRRFAPTLWPTLGMLVLVAATVSLGNWQRNRAAQKEALAAEIAAAAARPAVELTGEERVAAPILFRGVRATGEFDAAHTVLIDNKVHAGKPGYEIVSPLCFGNGRCVLVERGWIEQGARRTELPTVTWPAGRVTVVGRASEPPRRYLEFGSRKPEGALWQNLDIARIAAETRLDLLPFVIEQEPGPADGLVRDWPPPDLGIERNRSYMIQWYSLAALAIILWLALNWRTRDAGNASER